MGSNPARCNKSTTGEGQRETTSENSIRKKRLKTPDFGFCHNWNRAVGAVSMYRYVTKRQ